MVTKQSLCQTAAYVSGPTASVSSPINGVLMCPTQGVLRGSHRLRLRHRSCCLYPEGFLFLAVLSLCCGTWPSLVVAYGLLSLCGVLAPQLGTEPTSSGLKGYS